MLISHVGKKETVDSPRYHHRYTEKAVPRVIVQWTRKGYGIYENDHETLAVGEESAFVIVLPERVAYFYPKECKAPWIIDWIDITGELALKLFGGFKQQFGPVVSLQRKGPAGILLSRMITKVQNGEIRSRSESSGAIHAFLVEWWLEAGRQEKEQRLSSVIEACTGSGVTRFMTIKELAAECGMSREYFTRCFIRQMGTSPAAWLRQRRLAHAAHLLKEEPSLPLAAVARQTGFATGRQLSASFRRAYGTPIAAYRRAG